MMAYNKNRGVIEVEFTSTTNTKFKFMQGSRIPNSSFIVGTSIFYDDLRTSRVDEIKYEYGKDYIRVNVKTKNSKYVFTMKDKERE